MTVVPWQWSVASMVSNKKCTVGGVDGAVRGDGVGRGDIMGMGMVWRWSDGVGMG